MSSDNPFDGKNTDGTPFGGSHSGFDNAGIDDADRTVIRPTPGGQQFHTPPAPTPVAPAPAAPQQPAYQPPPAYAQTPVPDTSNNTLVDAAAKILALIGRLKTTAQHNDVNGLHRQVIQEIQLFDANARANGATPEAILAGRYSLCAAIDEAVLNTPWGSNSTWSNQGMLSTFHQEAWGGEKVFQILDRIRQQPAGNIDLLELIDTCISLGFEGKFRVQQNGHVQLDALRDELLNIIRMQKGDYERELSPHWRGLTTRKNTLTRYVPYWVVAALAGALVLSIYIGFNFALHSSAKPLIEDLNEIAPDPDIAIIRGNT
ncbi:MAG: DotU family type IV/VI secretion system protein [Gammaproteobacteria bacterium]|nr:DotU family type IV/VI secretion system protein [Gammaproteobacteria bacterium]